MLSNLYIALQIWWK